MRQKIPILTDTDYEYYAKLAEKYTVDEMETKINDLKKDQYVDCRGNTGLIQSLERAIDVRKAWESRKQDKVSEMYFSLYEKVDPAEEAAYLNLAEASFDI